MSTKLQLIGNLQQDSHMLRTIRSEYEKEVSKSDVDKYALRFDHADRGLEIFEFNLALVCYTGRYGCSSVYRFKSVQDRAAVRDAFYEYLNSNMSVVLNGVSEILQKKAVGLCEEAQKEVDTFQKQLDSLRTTCPSVEPPSAGENGEG